MSTCETVATGLEFPEGPIALRDGSVLLVEIKRGTLTRVRADGAVEVVAELGGGPNGAAIGPDGAVYVCNNGGLRFETRPGGITAPCGVPADYAGGSIQRVDLRSGAVTKLYTHCNGQPLRGPNDLVFDRSGGFWFTDIGKSMPEYAYHGALYYARPDGSLIARAEVALHTPNGVGLSPDETTLYVAESVTARVRCFALDGPGVIRTTGRLQAAQVMGPVPGHEFFDSLAVEADGRVCVATILRGGITSFARGGDTEFFAAPKAFITNICFGGDDMRDAWITAGGPGELYRTRWPRPGLRLAFNA